MPISTWNPSDHPERVIHETSTDFVKRPVVKTVHIVQYDNTLPVVAVSLYNNGNPYQLPDTISSVKIRWGKKDRTFVIKDVLGYKRIQNNPDIVYFEVDSNMAFFYGPLFPNLEITYTTGSGEEMVTRTMHTMAIPFEIDRNSVQVTDIESKTDYPDLEKAIERAEQAVERAEEAVEKAVDAEAWAVGERDGEPVPPEDPQYQNNSKYYAEEAADLADAASSSASSASSSASNAASSATSAATDAANAHTYEQKIENMQVEAEILPVNNNPTVTKEDVLTYFKLKFGMPVPKQITGVTKIDTHDEVDTYRISFNDNTHFDFTVTNAEISGAVLSVNGRQGHVTGLAEDNGYYAKMGVGYADQIVSTRGVEDTPENDPEYNPFAYRTTAGDQDVSNGNAEVIEMRGNSYVKNQAIHNNKITQTFTFTNGHAQGWLNDITGTFDILDIPAGHKVFVIVENNNPKICLCFGVNGSGILDGRYTERSKSGMAIRELPSLDNYSLYLYGEQTIEAGEAVTISCRIVDITQLDQSLANTTGLTPEMVLAKYPNILTWKYDSGTIVNVKPNGIKTIGFNQWDEEWEVGTIDTVTGQNISSPSRYRSKNYINVISGNTYYLKMPTANNQYALFYKYDENKNFLGINYFSNGSTFTVLNNVKYYRFSVVDGGVTYNHDICINLSWSGYRNGEYEPYKEDFRPIAVKTYFPDGMNGIGNVYDELHKDRYIKRFGNVKLKDFNWSYDSTNDVFYTELPANFKLPATLDTPFKGLCKNYNIVSYRNRKTDKSIVTSWTTASSFYLYIADSRFTDATDFKNHFTDDDILIYELATPVETPIDPELNMLYYAEDFGTEEWTYDNGDEPVSVPCVLKYLGNLVDKLENLNPFTDEEHASLLALIKGGN